MLQSLQGLEGTELDLYDHLAFLGFCNGVYQEGKLGRAANARSPIRMPVTSMPHPTQSRLPLPTAPATSAIGESGWFFLFTHTACRRGEAQLQSLPRTYLPHTLFT